MFFKAVLMSRNMTGKKESMMGMGSHKGLGQLLSYCDDVLLIPGKEGVKRIIVFTRTINL